jgi:spore coat polysaccharide biosynthesis protein SpsF
MQTGIVIFARASSARLPGKMLATLGDTTLLGRIVARAGMLGRPMIVATSTEPADDAVVTAVTNAGLAVYRGSLGDVLQRGLEAARRMGFHAFARLCGDRPFFPIDDLRAALEVFEQPDRSDDLPDLVTTRLDRPVAAGTTTEVIRTEALASAAERVTCDDDREHMTRVFYRDRECFRIHEIATSMRMPADASLAIDTAEDLERIRSVVMRLPDIDASPDEAWRLLTGAC